MNLKRGFGNSRGQVTIFIIIAILIVAIAVLIYFLFPGLRSNVQGQASSPVQYIDTCMREKIGTTMETITLNGGSLTPSTAGSYNYLGTRISYLCYTNQYYSKCVSQEPLLLNHMQNEIEEEIADDVDACFNSMIQNYQDDGYTATLKNPTTESVVEILPERIIVTFDNELTLTKGETQTYKNFQVAIDSKIYELYGIVMSIVDWEQSYGDAPLQTYMAYYPDLFIKIEERGSDGTKVYSVEELNSGDKFNFAVRSLVLPPGY